MTVRIRRVEYLDAREYSGIDVTGSTYPTVQFRGNLYYKVTSWWEGKAGKTWDSRQAAEKELLKIEGVHPNQISPEGETYVLYTLHETTR